MRSIKYKRYQVFRAKIQNKRRRAYVNYKKTSPCTDCKQIFNPWVMQFDHKDPKLKFKDVAFLLNRGYPIALIDIEIEKCDLVCANCHAERTHKQIINKEINFERPQGRVYPL